MDNKFKMMTFNVKGLQNRVKRLNVLNFGKEKIQNNGLLLFQETHSAKKDLKGWKNDWKGDIFLNHGTSNSRGVMIAFTESFDKKTLKYVDDKNGRIQIIAFEHLSRKYLIVNIYNNNIEREQVETLKKLDELLGQFQDLEDFSIIMGGDWNFILDKSLDAYGGNPKLNLNSIAEHIKLKKIFFYVIFLESEMMD